MNNSLVKYKSITPEVIAVDSQSDGIHMDGAIETARAAAKYASQLAHEYHSILHRQLYKYDPRLAGMFNTLIAELTTMTDVTYENVRSRRK